MRAKLIQLITMTSNVSEISYNKLRRYTDSQLQELADYVNLNYYERHRHSDEV